MWTRRIMVRKVKVDFVWWTRELPPPFKNVGLEVCRIAIGFQVSGFRCGFSLIISISSGESLQRSCAHSRILQNF